MSVVPTVAEFTEEFFQNHVNPHNKPSEQKAKRQIFANHILPHLGTKRLDEIRPRDIAAFSAAMASSGVGPKTINNRLKVIQKMLSCAVEWEIIKATPPIKLSKVVQEDATFLTPSQIVDLCSVATEHPWSAMIRVALNTGLRIGELRALRWKDVDLGDKSLRVVQATWSYTKELGPPKSGKPRTVPLNDAAQLAFKGFLHGGPYVFSLPHPHGILGYTGCRNEIRRLFRAAGIPSREGDGWHTLRHTFASHMAMRGVPLATLQKLLGHASISTTMRYAHLLPETGHEAVEALEGLTQPLKKL